MQTFGLHEGAERDAPAPMGWIVAMASVHKDQHLPRARPRASASKMPGPASTGTRALPTVPTEPAAPEKSALPLKLFVLALAIGLCVTALFGLTIAFANPRTRRQNALALGLGTLVPVVLLFF